MTVYKRRLLKKSSNRKSKPVLSRLVTAWLSNTAVHLQPIWLQTLVAIDSESRLTLFPSFCAPPSEATVLFYSNMSRRPFLGQVVNLDLLLFTGFNSEHAVLSLRHILLRDQWLIERLSKAMGAALFGNKISPIPSKISFHMKKKWLLAAQNLHLNPFDSGSESVSQEWQHVFLKRACRGPQRMPQTRKRSVFVLARPTSQSCAWPRLQVLGHWFCSQNLRLSSGIAFGENARWQAWTQTWTQTCILPPEQRV